MNFGILWTIAAIIGTIIALNLSIGFYEKKDYVRMGITIVVSFILFSPISGIIVAAWPPLTSVRKIEIHRPRTWIDENKYPYKLKEDEK